MQNQSMEIPEHLQPAWGAASEELRQASLELQQAQERYNQAVLARIALTAELNDKVV